MNEGVEVLQRCFAGERFSYHGKRYQFEDVIITPGYVQSEGPPLWIAAMSEAGAARAAHYGANLLPQGLRRRSFDPWVSAVRAAGCSPTDYRVGIIRSVLVTDDRDTDWPLVRAAEKYRMALYQRFFEESGEGLGEKGDPIPQTWIVGDVDHCVTELKAFIEDFGITDLVTMAMPPGLRAERMASSLERLFKAVVLRVKAAFNRG